MGVRSLPTVVLFKDGQPADHFMGALSEGELGRCSMARRESRGIATESAELVERGQYEEAIALFIDHSRRS